MKNYSLETPIQFIDNDYCNNKIFMKREDLIPFSFGGNKARKAIKFFDKIDEGDYDVIITYGSSSSNHCRIISNIAASKNIPCYIIGPEEESKKTFNSKMMELLGTDITIVPVNDVHDTIERKIKLLKEQGFKPYFIEGGGHGNIGTEAMIGCYKEIYDYSLENDMKFDYIFFASGTGTTQAGLICGKLLLEDSPNLVGISIARKNPRGRNVILDSIHDYLTENNIYISKETIEKETVFIDEYTGSKYGETNDGINKVISETLLKYGIPLDSTYTGKAFYGMQEYIRENKIENKNILFIHTGGTPLFFDYLKEK